MLSHPARDAWIEIWREENNHLIVVSHPARDAWIEITVAMWETGEAFPSHPARDAWIEIPICKRLSAPFMVASREGCVD